MAIPYSTERVLDMVIRSLRASGLIADDVSAESIRNVANNESDAGLDALAATLNYGGVSGTAGDALFAIEDFDLVIDTDNSQSGFGPYYQQFRVERGVNTLPVTDPANHLMSVGNYRYDIALPGSTAPLLTVGPAADIGAGADYRAGVAIGHDDAAGAPFGRLYGATNITGKGPGLLVRGSQYLELQALTNVFLSCDDRVDFTDRSTSPSVRGGFTDLVSDARLFVGDDNTENVLYMERLTDTAGDFHFQLRPKREAGVTPISARKIFVKGSSAALDYPIYLSVGGSLEDSATDPWEIGYPTFSVVGNTGASHPVCKFIYPDASWTATGDNATFHFHTEAQDMPATPYYIFRITKALTPPFVQGLFNIDSSGDANLKNTGSYNSAGADAAEWLDTVEEGEEFEVGTVLVINSKGKLEPSSFRADTRVVGVVSNSAGLKLGSPGDVVELGGVKPKDKALVAAIGRVPVRCRASNGPITPGSLLVSGPGGCAVRGGSSTNSAAILGKALGTLKDGEGKVEALVSW